MRSRRAFVVSVVAIAVVCLAVAAAGVALATSPGAGCGPPLAGLPAPGTTSYSLVSGGIRRCFRLHLPETLELRQASALVISLHGLVSNARGQEYLSRWDAIADREGFLVVYPQGTGSPLRWNASDEFQASTIDDVQFLRDLLAELSRVFQIDPARIYVNGMSNGGAMTHRLTCELADVVAVAGIVAGPPTSPPAGCRPVRPVPVIAFYGSDDPLVPYRGSQAPAGELPWWLRWMHVHLTGALPPIETWVADWAERNGCQMTPLVLPATAGVSAIRYPGCAGEAEVILYTVSGGGHTWPGGRPIPVGRTTDEVSASELMWAFFEAHPLAD